MSVHGWARGDGRSAGERSGRAHRERRSPAARRTGALAHLDLPDRHAVKTSDVVPRRLHGAIAAAAERGPGAFQELLLTPGVGARTVLSLALAAEVIHGAPCRFTDPARFSLAHGGKDGHPFPVPVRVYDETLRVLRGAVERAKLGNDDRLEAIRRLDAEARRLERAATGPTLDAFVAAERAELAVRRPDGVRAGAAAGARAAGAARLARAQGRAARARPARGAGDDVSAPSGGSMRDPGRRTNRGAGPSHRGALGFQPGLTRSSESSTARCAA